MGTHGLDMDGLVERLIDIGPYDESSTRKTNDDTPPPPVEEINYSYGS